ncbi:Uncharacterized protein Adt_43275 [Abeliophyllum distichum]|uniref:Uncharacterized protein n=1 Tax=Abeliophyllum distichum TaxID=126358 RepID=A0ABD1PWW1_9LAMI
MKKLVPKKLRSSKKKEHNSESSEISSVREDTIASCEEQEADESEDEKESKFLEPNCVEGIQCEKMIIDEYSCEGKLGYQDISLKKVMMEEEVLELKRRKSRKDKIKSKMKKLVPKKLRSSKKEDNNSEGSEIYSIREDTISTCEEDESEDEKNQKL